MNFEGRSRLVFKEQGCRDHRRDLINVCEKLRYKLMEAIREIKKVRNHQVLIDLPNNYENEDVEIIILPLMNKKRQKTLSDLLLDGPVWSKKEVKNFEENLQEGYTNWKLEEI